MATPTTVLEFATNRRDHDLAAATSARATLTASQAALAAARTTLATATAGLTAKDRAVAAKRLEVASADTPAEGTALLAELMALIREYRVLQAQVGEARDAAGDAEANSTAAAAELARATAQLADAEADLVVATAGGARREGWKTGATAPPLDTLADDATAALAAEPYTTASDLVADALPPKLLAAVRAGFDQEAARAARLQASRTAAEDLLMNELETNDGARGLRERREMELERAERALREWTEQARTRFDRALSLLDSIASGGALLTATESDRVQELDVSAGQDAADLRVALEENRQAALDAQLDLDEATRAALAVHPADDPATDPGVVAAKAASDAAAAALAAAASDYAAAEADFTAWTVEIPDAAWRRVISFLEADAILRALGDTAAADVTALVDAVTDAETDLAAALDAEETHRNTIAFLGAYVTQRAGRVTRSGATHPTRLLGAVRADV
jgi:hypothetical protein